MSAPTMASRSPSLAHAAIARWIFYARGVRDTLSSMRIAVRPASASAGDFEAIMSYFLDAPRAALEAMGVDPARLPNRAEWRAALLADAERPDAERDRFFVVWSVDDRAVGHSSINKIVLGEEAYVHLHMWRPDLRRAGLGSALFRLSVAYFFERFRLERLWCEPYAENPGPNRVLAKVGFEHVRRYRTVPGAINFEQDVNRWTMQRYQLEPPPPEPSEERRSGGSERDGGS